MVANGEVAQLARAIGSYPIGREFESHPRYHNTSQKWSIFFTYSTRLSLELPHNFSYSLHLILYSICCVK